MGNFLHHHNWAATLVTAGLDLLFPPVCAGCGRLGELFCPQCAQAVTPVPAPICAHCGRPQPAPQDRCHECRAIQADPLVLTRAAALHTHPLREAIHAFKYENRPELGPLLARYLITVFAHAPWRGLALDAVAPVPLHAERLAARGYNQSALLAAALTAAVELPLAQEWLARTRLTQQQVGLNHHERHANVDGAFTASAAVAGKRILLIDDVYTTGATLRACAQAAQAAGAAALYGLTLTIPHQASGDHTASRPDGQHARDR